MIVGFLTFSLAFSAQAVCPVCTVAVGAGVGLSRWLGIDDTITGLWIGGLTLSMIVWTLNWFKKKEINFPGKNLLTIIGYVLLIYISLVWTDLINHPDNTLWGFDKLLLGAAVGSVFFIAANATYNLLKEKNNGHAYFPYQKVAMPVGTLLILSFAFYFITK